MKRTVLYIAMSLDGYIADANGGVDWIAGEDDNAEDMGSYHKFIKTVDTVVMGYNTYDQIISELSPDEWPYKNLNTYVVTNKTPKPKNKITFTNQDLEALIAELKEGKGKDIWICGGSNLVNQLVSLDLIDRYVITIIPQILGDGIPLFENGLPHQELKLASSTSHNGMVEVTYYKK